MNSGKLKTSISIFLVLVMLASLAGCGQGKQSAASSAQSESAQTTADAIQSQSTDAEADAASGQSSQANHSFTLIVVDKEGNETSFDIITQKETVGEALIDENLIEGDYGEYGLYVKKVNGIEAIYEDDGYYWAFYVNGEYGTSGVDLTSIEDGSTYMFRADKAG